MIGDDDRSLASLSESLKLKRIFFEIQVSGKDRRKNNSVYRKNESLTGILSVRGNLRFKFFLFETCI